MASCATGITPILSCIAGRMGSGAAVCTCRLQGGAGHWESGAVDGACTAPCPAMWVVAVSSAAAWAPAQAGGAADVPSSDVTPAVMGGTGVGMATRAGSTCPPPTPGAEGASFRPPQHHSVESSRIAQVLSAPQLTMDTRGSHPCTPSSPGVVPVLLERPSTTREGIGFISRVLLFPSCPSAPRPQHHKLPSDTVMHVWDLPVATVLMCAAPSEQEWMNDVFTNCGVV